MMSILYKCYRKVLVNPLTQWVYLRFGKINFIENFKALDISSMIDYMKGGGSIVRFGDGEILILEGRGAPDYQEYSAELQKSLLKVFKSNNSNLLVCIPRCLNGGKDFSILTTRAAYFWARFAVHNFEWLTKHINPEQLYGDTEISRPWIDSLNRERAGYVFQEFKNLFRDRKLVIIEGRYTRFGCGNDLILKARKISRIIGPEKNAFNYCSQFIEEATKCDKDSLIIVSLGPAGKVVTYELVQKGYQVWDLGHLDIEYEWFIRNNHKKMLIPGKYVNETNDKIMDTTNPDILQYEKQVIRRISV